MSKLTEVVKNCAGGMVKYQNGDDTEQIVSTYLHHLCKDEQTEEQLLLILDTQLAYMNSNYEDFIAGKQVVRKGGLPLSSVSMLTEGFKQLWFTLTTKALMWFKDHKEKKGKYWLPLDDIPGSGILTFKHSCEPFQTDGRRNMYQDYGHLGLSADAQDGADKWKVSLLRTGVYSDRSQDGQMVKTSKYNIGSEDPQVECQMETIHAYNQNSQSSSMNGHVSPGMMRRAASGSPTHPVPPSYMHNRPRAQVPSRPRSYPLFGRWSTLRLEYKL